MDEKWRAFRSVPARTFGFMLLLLLAGCRELPANTPAGTPPTRTATPLPTPSPTAAPTLTATLPRSTTPAPVDSPPPAMPVHHIFVRTVAGRGEFVDTRTLRRFVPRGVNYHFVPSGSGYTNRLLEVGVYDPDRTRADFAALAGYGYNTVRVFFDQCNRGPTCIGDADNDGLNPAYLDNIADLLAAARETGIYVLLTSNDLPDQGGYAEEANAQEGEIFAGYRNSYYLTPGAVNATRRYWRDLISGLAARDAATEMVLGWQLLNEQWMFVAQPPLSLTSGLVTTTTGSYDMADPEQKRRMVSDGLIYYIAQVKAEILSLDPSALVTMGFFAPEISTPDWYVETASLLASADLDFFDFHGYPGTHTMREHAAAYGMIGYERKPIILGEYGPFRHIYATQNSAARVITAWRADACLLGFDGWYYWTYYPTNSDVGDRTWSLVDDDGYLLSLLAPAANPDPCVAVEVPRSNLAYGRPVRVSRALPDEPAEAAVDENGDSQWGSGGDAPQWIQIDLETAYDVTEIRLLVAQWPEGRTVHVVYGWYDDDPEVELHRFDQVTRDGDWLVFSPAAPIRGLRGLTIETTSSPSWVSWREVEVRGSPSP